MERIHQTGPEETQYFYIWLNNNWTQNLHCQHGLRALLDEQCGGSWNGFGLQTELNPDLLLFRLLLPCIKRHNHNVRLLSSGFKTQGLTWTLFFKRLDTCGTLWREGGPCCKPLFENSVKYLVLGSREISDISLSLAFLNHLAVRVSSCSMQGFWVNFQVPIIPQEVPKCLLQRCGVARGREAGDAVGTLSHP